MYLAGILSFLVPHSSTLYVRKEDEKSHGGVMVGITPHVDPKCFNIFVDDFVATGATLREVIAKIVNAQGEIHGIILLSVSGNDRVETILRASTLQTNKPKWVITLERPTE